MSAGFFAFGFFWGSLPSVAIDDVTIKVMQIDWCPQICPNQEKPGYAVEIVEEAFKSSRYKLSYQILPWSRAIVRVRSGAGNALLAPAKKEAPDLVFPAREIGIQRMCFFVRKSSSWQFDGIESLAGRKIGIATDTSIEELNEYIASNSEQFYRMPYTKDYIPHSLKMLDIGRFDTFVFSYNSTVFAMAGTDLGERIKLAGCVSAAPIYLAFQPGDPGNFPRDEIVTFFDKRIGEMKNTGRIAAIMESYGLPDWSASQ